MRFQKVTFRTHAIQRMFERAISTEDVRPILETGEVIAHYPEIVPIPAS